MAFPIYRSLVDGQFPELPLTRKQFPAIHLGAAEQDQTLAPFHPPSINSLLHKVHLSHSANSCQFNLSALCGQDTMLLISLSRTTSLRIELPDALASACTRSQHFTAWLTLRAWPNHIGKATTDSTFPWSGQRRNSGEFRIIYTASLLSRGCLGMMFQAPTMGRLRQQ